jgi:hypothetical protein
MDLACSKGPQSPTTMLMLKKEPSTWEEREGVKPLSLHFLKERKKGILQVFKSVVRNLLVFLLSARKKWGGTLSTYLFCPGGALPTGFWFSVSVCCVCPEPMHDGC